MPYHGPSRQPFDFTVQFLLAAAQHALLGGEGHDPPLAERRAREALTLLVPGLGHGHPWTAAAWDLLALALDEQHKHEEAEACYLKSLASQQAAGWPEIVSADRTALRLAALYDRLGKPGLNAAIAHWLRERHRPDRNPPAPVPTGEPEGPGTVGGRSYVVIAPYGFETEAVGAFVRIVSRFDSRCWVSTNDMVADGRSPMSLLLLAADTGDVLNVVADGDDAVQLLRAVDRHPGLVRAPTER